MCNAVLPAEAQAAYNEPDDPEEEDDQEQLIATGDPGAASYSTDRWGQEDADEDRGANVSLPSFGGGGGDDDFSLCGHVDCEHICRNENRPFFLICGGITLLISIILLAFSFDIVKPTQV